MEIEKKKVRYNAPEMKATAFRAEQGYATSVTSTGLSIKLGGDTL